MAQLSIEFQSPHHSTSRVVFADIPDKMMEAIKLEWQTSSRPPINITIRDNINGEGILRATIN